MGEHDIETLRNIWIRLDNVLENTLAPKGKDEAAFSYEFMMAGPSKNRFKPSVLIVCSNHRQRKALKAILGKQSWLRDYPYFWQVIVDPIDKLCKDCASQGTWDTTSTKVFVPEGTVALLGSPARSGEAKFTIGGVIFIDGKPYGLTAGHPFHVPSDVLSEDTAKSAVEWLEDSDEDAEDDPIFNFADDDSAQAVDPKKITLIRPRFPPLTHPKSVVWNPTSPIGVVRRPADNHSHLDWAVIELCARTRWPVNQLSIPGQDSSTLIDSVLESSKLLSGQVWVKSGYGGLVRGTVHAWPAFLHLNGTKFETWQIWLDEPFGKGDSGSWVIQDSKLCGHIIAGRRAVSSVYMLRICDIIGDIKCWAKAQSVDLQSPVDHETPVASFAPPPPPTTMTETANIALCEPDASATQLLAEDVECIAEPERPNTSSGLGPSSKAIFDAKWKNQDFQQRLNSAQDSPDSDTETLLSTVSTLWGSTARNTFSTDTTTTGVNEPYESMARSRRHYQKQRRFLRQSMANLAEQQKHLREPAPLVPPKTPFQFDPKPPKPSFDPVSSLKTYLSAASAQGSSLRNTDGDKAEIRHDSGLEDHIQLVHTEGTRIRGYLVPYAYTDEDLVKHIQMLDVDPNDPAAVILRGILQRKDEVSPDNVMTYRWDAGYRICDRLHPTFEVYDVNKDSTAIPITREHVGPGIFDSTGAAEDLDAWDAFRRLDRTSKGPVGRIIVLDDPSVSILAAIHFTMRSHFDMNELFGQLPPAAKDQGRSKALVNRFFEREPLCKRSFLIALRYYAILDDGKSSATWHENELWKQDDVAQVSLAQCTSILALALEDTESKSPRAKQGSGSKTCKMQDVNVPWHLLGIHYYPDRKSSPRNIESKQFFNGPHALMWAMAKEYRDAVARYKDIYNTIETMVRMDRTSFIFDAKSLDRRNHESRHLLLTRRYNWVHATLGELTASIRELIAAYAETFAFDPWCGQHQALWPEWDLKSVQSETYLRTMWEVKVDIDISTTDLREIMKRNEILTSKTTELLEQLHQDSAIRKSVDRGEQLDLVRLLAFGSVVFLPLTFAAVVAVRNHNV
ncbi:hypothetical protein QBC34DRAFT_437509 [Podospora aff. communis PSN243]|uniref:Uncharacterized protein n=1 Tax=Podospora aff. communis PSN243 TaxID=3040156 RepID=A0AAV9GSB9_9PEZI|nr:hypothetical protein QBC34DRAFT_437509 [Podospora aff. communis PSN243]